MHQKKQPFTYLMPADRAYYEPFQFTFVMDWEETEINLSNSADRIIPASQQDMNLQGQSLQEKKSQETRIIKIPKEE